MALTYTLEDYAAAPREPEPSWKAIAFQDEAGHPPRRLIARRLGRKTQRDFAPMPTSINYADV